MIAAVLLTSPTAAEIQAAQAEERARADEAAAKRARADEAAERKKLQIASIGAKVAALLPLDLRASEPTNSVLYKQLAASLLAAPSKARAAHYAAIAEPLGRAWNAVASAGLLVSERTLARTFLLCCGRAGSAVSALRRGQPGLRLGIVRTAWPASCGAVRMPFLPIDRATAEPSIFIDALYHPPIVARIRASVGRDIRAWFEYFKQLCGYAAKLARLGARNDVIAEALWTKHIYLPYEASNPFRLFLDAFPLKAPAVTTTAPASPVALRGRARYEPPPIISEAELFESLARPPRTAAEAAASMAMADECFAQLTRTLECGVKRYVALERNWAEYTSLSWLPAARRTLVKTDTECGGHWLSAVQRVVPRHIVWNRPEHAWFGLLEASDFEGLLLFHRQQAATDLTDEIRRRAYEEERAAARQRLDTAKLVAAATVSSPQ